ncbi:unnamed protein product [Protopolystoma xenopodis]|uniref:Uncharacterized protein n=1 Tax=Protopolystoma xenopodis TaxID=117903 RepID=A0A448WWT2_9PLAT|nr:unnamed protein product [Protopolystoma xenopodis]
MFSILRLLRGPTVSEAHFHIHSLLIPTALFFSTFTLPRRADSPSNASLPYNHQACTKSSSSPPAPTHAAQEEVQLTPPKVVCTESVSVAPPPPLPLILCSDAEQTQADAQDESPGRAVPASDAADDVAASSTTSDHNIDTATESLEEAERDGVAANGDAEAEVDDGRCKEPSNDEHDHEEAGPDMLASNDAVDEHSRYEVSMDNGS